MTTSVIELRPAPQVGAPLPKRRRLTSGRHLWPGKTGGFIHVALDGGLSFYAVRKIQGKRYGPVLLGHEAAIAEKQYERWWPNPLGWNPAGVAPPEGVYLTADLIERYAQWCNAVPHGKKGKRNRDPDWIRQKVNRLSWWLKKLHGRNLRSDGSPGCVTMDDINAILNADPTDYRHRLITIRAFYTFLRTSSDLLQSQRVLIQHDPAKDIPVPSPEAAQATKGSKVAWTREDSDKAIAWLEAYVPSAGHGGKGTATPRTRAPDGKDMFTAEEAATHLGLTVATVRAYAERGLLQHEGGGQGVDAGGAEGGGRATLVFRRRHLDRFERSRKRGTRDTPHRVALALVVLGGTSAHAREIARFSVNGLVTDLPADHLVQNGAAKAIVFDHKSGKEHAQPVSEKVAKAAEELRRLGGVSYQAIFKWTKKAVDATDAARFTPGRFRHRGATMQVNQGVPIEDVGEGIGHANVKTTLIYVTKSVPPKQPTWY